jgi:hypothetical protein
VITTSWFSDRYMKKGVCVAGLQVLCGGFRLDVRLDVWLGARWGIGLDIGLGIGLVVG